MDKIWKKIRQLEGKNYAPVVRVVAIGTQGVPLLDITYTGSAVVYDFLTPAIHRTAAISKKNTVYRPGHALLYTGGIP